MPCRPWSSAVLRVRCHDLQDLRGHSLLPRLLEAQFPSGEGFWWQFAPNGSKTQQSRRAGALLLRVLSYADQYSDPCAASLKETKFGRPTERRSYRPKTRRGWGRSRCMQLSVVHVPLPPGPGPGSPAPPHHHTHTLSSPMPAVQLILTKEASVAKSLQMMAAMKSSLPLKTNTEGGPVHP